MTVPKANTEALLNAAHIGHAVAALLDASSDSMADAAISARTLAKHLANQAMLLSTPSISLTEVVLGAGDTAHIHGNGDVELVRSGTITYIGPHASDCATNNRGVPELLGPCDCEAPGPSRFESLDMVCYLNAAARNGQIDHNLRCVASGNGQAEFYIHPATGDGQTIQFVAKVAA